ncbi:hypothetical protein [Acinetobacter boissieri]|uniref:Uncharacterized protein n=1 Tax=Acinetobacter boissieri TaxID=1219383 RepID=A0A1G6HDE6_9GAMM|nr:hypothetical protein [Acinetobacter boissieri]SDB92337.1 hypothetical protein SAMN05421733_10563 [Acinetobacter boissieri]
MSNEKKPLRIITPIEAHAYLQGLDDDIWFFLCLAVDVIISFYTKDSKFEYDVDGTTLFSISLLEDEPKSIFEFRDRFKHFILKNGDIFRKLNEFPEGYNAKNKKLTKNQDGELGLYFALKHCAVYKNSTSAIDDIYYLNRANFLLGHSMALLGINSFWKNSLHNEVNLHELGGKKKALKYESIKKAVYAEWDKNIYHTYTACADVLLLEFKSINGISHRTICLWLSTYEKEKKNTVC